MKKLLLLSAFTACFIASAQQARTVDFEQITATLSPDLGSKQLEGRLEVRFKALTNTDSIYLDARIDSLKILETPKKLTISKGKDKIWFVGDFKANRQYTFNFWYQVKPEQTLYFFQDQFWTQGQGKYTSYWLPSLDDMNDKIEFDLSIRMPAEYQVIANGALKSSTKNAAYTLWEFNMNQPMSSYLVVIAAGKYQKQVLESDSGVSLENYFYVGDDLKVEPTYRYTKQIFDFFERKIGVLFPWQNYKQLPVRDFLYAGMENTTATVFSEAFVTDSTGFVDRNYVNVNAHELAHQWFGNLVTEVSAQEHWLHEGFATYYALLAEREIFGDDYYFWKLYQSAEQLKELSEQGKGEALNNPKASSLTFYEKGAWALHILNEQLGDLYFDTAIKTYLERFAYSNVTITDFLNIAEEVSGSDLTQFKDDWITQSAFKSEQVLSSLSKNAAIVDYFNAQALRKLTWEEKQQRLLSLVESNNEYVAQEAVYQLSDVPIAKSMLAYNTALNSGNLLTRQAVAMTLTQVPEALRLEYESLLSDASYVTQEAALYNLWNSFPEYRERYLDQSSEFVGFQNKNVRQLWLVLALVTDTYKPDNKRDYILELMDYGTATYSFEVRELALTYLFDLGIVNEQTITALVDACMHPNWRFKSSSRKILERIGKEPINKGLITQMLDGFDPAEQAYLRSSVLK